MDLRVFLVDDLISMHSLMQEVFARIGGLKLAATATTEGEAKMWLEDHPQGWDLAVVDLVLREGSGMGVIGRCKEKNRTAPVAVFSAYVTPVLREHCLRLGADAVFSKEETGSFVAWLHAQVQGDAPAP